MINKTTKFLISLTISLVIFLALIMPALSLAQDANFVQGKSLVPCGNDIYPQGSTKTDPSTNQTIDVSGQPVNPCDFNYLMTLVRTGINFILFYMAMPISAISFAYAGFLLVTAGGEAAHARTKAKTIFFHTAIGLAIAVAAWIIVHTILSVLGYNGAWIGF